jgi:glycosyltransferase involved in cell wall biosynthesis
VQAEGASPRYTVVIPAFNEERTLSRLLAALARCERSDVQVIVVSDASSDGTDAVAAAAGVRLLRLPVQRGPAGARNAGAAVATAPFLLFLDADVVPPPDLFQVLDAHRTRRPNLRCFTGVYSIRPAVDGWFQRYRAVINDSYVRQLDDDAPSTLFVTAIAGIERALFEQLGGFDEGPGARQAEDTEFGYRVTRHAEVRLLRDMQVMHEFPDFSANLKTYFQRSRAWIRLYGRRRRFDNHTTTPGTACLRALGAATGGSTLAALLVPPLWPLSLSLHGAYLLANRRVFSSLIHHTRLSDLPRTYAADLCLGLAVIAGATAGAGDVVREQLWSSRARPPWRRTEAGAA